MALIDLQFEYLHMLFDILLKDKNTGKNIIWGTNDYIKRGIEYSANSEITYESLNGLEVELLQPRVTKSKEVQKSRTKDKAEVFTPSWVCENMNNYCEQDWIKKNKNKFDEKLGIVCYEFLKSYVDIKKLEITCGEAPFVVSRYDTTTGDLIPLYNRIGFLDKKLTSICHYINDMDEWFEMVCRAYESCYGYEYQGDNLFKARINLVLTFIDYYEKKWVRGFPSNAQLKRIANIVSKNFWQMDGLTNTAPNTDIKCRVYNWRSKKNMNILGEGSMKFDYILGNPPYQGDNHKQIYTDFYLSAIQMGNCVELIFPIGWQEPKTAKNLGKLNTPEIKEDKQIVFIDNRQNVFLGIQGAEWTNIILWKRGYNNKLNGKQLVYTNGKNPEIRQILWDKESIENIPNELKEIISHFTKDEKNNFSSIVYSGRSVLKFTDEFLKDFPESPKIRLEAIQKKQPNTTKLNPNEEYELKTATFEVLDMAFVEDDPNDNINYFKLYGSYNGKRTVRWILKKYMKPRYADKNNINFYKVLLAEAASAGDFGAKLSDTIIATPNESCTPTFCGVGCFDTFCEAENCSKYIKTKFFRTLLGVLKTTRHNPSSVFAYIPLQNFTENSDIDWSVSISEIDKQLYKKYGLDEKEIAFIEEKVKEME